MRFTAAKLEAADQLVENGVIHYLRAYKLHLTPISPEADAAKVDLDGTALALATIRNVDGTAPNVDQFYAAKGDIRLAAEDALAEAGGDVRAAIDAQGRVIANALQTLPYGEPTR